MKTPRPFIKQELALLRDLWPTTVSDKDLEEIFRCPRGVLYRTARKTLQLAPRDTARREARSEYVRIVTASLRAGAEA